MAPALINALDEAAFAYHRQPRALAGAAVFSLLNLLFQIAACAALGRSLAINVPLSVYLAFFPTISVLTAIPLTPGSFGVRESLFMLLFGAVGVDAHHAVLLSLLFYAAGLVWSLAGGVAFLGYSAGAGFNLRAELARIRASGAETDAERPAAP